MTSHVHSFHSRAAMDRVREEMEFIRDEIDAFRRFDRRVERIPCVSDAQSGGATPGGTLAVQSNASPPSELKRAYQSTVMAVPHYESEYGDSFEESVRTEFDEPIEQVLLGLVPFTPLAKSRLVSASENACTNRSALLDDLERELSALSTATGRLEEWTAELDRIHERTTEWNDCRASEELARIERIREECDTLSSERQRRLRRQSKKTCQRGEPDRFVRYLYQEMPVTMPILADISSVGVRLDEERAHIQRQLTGGSY